MSHLYARHPLIKISRLTTQSHFEKKNAEMEQQKDLS